MVIYENTKEGFLKDLSNGGLTGILSALFASRHMGITNAERDSWNNSLPLIGRVLNDPGFDDDVKVYLEYQVFLLSKRVDFMIVGSDDMRHNNIVIVELKQWDRCKRTGKDCIVQAYTGGRLQEVPHPSYQASCYAGMMKAYNAVLQTENIGVASCCYLHNYDSGHKNELICAHYRAVVDESPVFIKGEERELAAYMQKFVCHKETAPVIQQVENSDVVPGKALQDSVAEIMVGTDAFFLIDEQKTVYEEVKKQTEETLASGKKAVIICQGGPGTGKSVVAVRLLFDLIRDEHSARYVTHNSALKNVYKDFLNRIGGKKKTYLESLFGGDAQFQSDRIGDNTYDCLIIDESHRITEHWSHKQDEQHIESLVRSAKVSVFFIDEKQRVTTKDFGTVRQIKAAAKAYGAGVYDAFELVSQFRCGGSDGYMQFVDRLLYDKGAAGTSESNYEVKVFRSAKKMQEALRARNSENKARIVAGYCYDWVTGKESAKKRAVKKFGIRPEEEATDPRLQYDICLPDGFYAKWNLSYDNTWATSPDSFDEVGCIHTSQGLEFDYCGVIIGKDLRFEGGKVITDQKRIAASDSTSGIRTCRDKTLADELIRNTYRTLLTRGQRGCFIYCEDEALSDHVLSLTGGIYADEVGTLTKDQENGLKVLETGDNCFVTGEAGTGKSFLIDRYTEKIRWKKKVLKCAPTGIAAAHIGGKTIHSVFRVPEFPQIRQKEEEADEYIVGRISGFDVIIIDEISMCRIDLFEYVLRIIDRASGLRKEAGKDRIQIVLCGDFFQLPPVVTQPESAILEELYGTKEGFAFESDAWRTHDFRVINLKENKRQGGVGSGEAAEFIEKLNDLRSHRNVAATLDYFNTHCRKKRIEEPSVIELHATNRFVDELNEKGLDKLPGKAVQYDAEIDGDISEEKYPAAKTIRLKKNARVMILKNDTAGNYQNGSIGTVKECLPDGVIVTVNGKDVYIVPADYRIPEDPVLEGGVVKQDRIPGKFRQIPLRLAYAMTVHKSQGQTFEYVNFDPRGDAKEFLQNGQLYVALSRVRTCESVFFYNQIVEAEWNTSQKVIDFYRRI